MIAPPVVARALAIAVLALGAGCRPRASETPRAESGVPAANRAVGTTTTGDGDRCAALALTPSAAYTTIDVPPPPGLLHASRFDSGASRALAFVDPPAGWQMPAGVTFEIVGAPRVERERIVVRGTLANTTATPQRVYLWDAGLGLFPLALTGTGITRHPVDPQTQRPEVYPATSLYLLPAGAQWTFESAVILPCYTFKPGQSATVRWTLTSEDHHIDGAIEVKLP